MIFIQQKTQYINTLQFQSMLLACSETDVLILQHVIHVLILILFFSFAKAQCLTGESYSGTVC